MLNKIHVNGIVLAGILILLLPSAHAYSYLHANGRIVARHGGEQLEFYHADSLGSTRTITNEAAQVIQKQKNLPFGGVLKGDERYGFTGKELDESGLQYFGARYYDSGTGRFLSTDPAMQYHSPYIYAGNNPLAYRDSDGNFAQFAPAIPFLATPLGWALVGGGLIITSFMAYQAVNGPLITTETFPAIEFPSSWNEIFPAEAPGVAWTESIPAEDPIGAWTETFPAAPDALLWNEQVIPPDMPDMSLMFAERVNKISRGLVLPPEEMKAFMGKIVEGGVMEFGEELPITCWYNKRWRSKRHATMEQARRGMEGASVYVITADVLNAEIVYRDEDGPGWNDNIEGRYPIGEYHTQGNAIVENARIFDYTLGRWKSLQPEESDWRPIE